MVQLDIQLWIVTTVAVLTLSVCSVSLGAEMNQSNDTRPVCPRNLKSRRVTRIVGGRNADNRFPFQVGLVSRYSTEVNKPSTICAAVLITDRHCLSAAHCFETWDPRTSFVADIGDYDLNSKKEASNAYREIVDVIRFSNFTRDTFDNDIVILKLGKPVSFNKNIKPACLPPNGSDVSPGTALIVLGWGHLKFNDSSVKNPTILQEVTVPVVDRITCATHLAINITENMICAGGEEGKDACSGDSGGALVMQVGNNYIVVGLVSYGSECALPDVAAGYTRLSAYISWIYENTKDASCQPCVLPEKDYPN